MSFEDWLESKGYMDGYGTDYQDAYDEGFDEGAKSQQAKIDELQARVDEALKSIMICEEYNHAKKLDEIYNILKAVEK